MSQGSKIQKDLVIRNSYVKYQSPTMKNMKVLSNKNIFEK